MTVCKTELDFGGKNPSLGRIFSSFISPEVEIRAFGPEALPLGTKGGFGVRSILYHDQKWASPICAPEVWFETQVHGDQIEMNFTGLSQEKPLAFSFYVKALSVKVGEMLIEKKSLHKYSGPNVPIFFSDLVKLELQIPTKLEVIPLSGDNSFWNCDYLVSFSLQYFNSKYLFKISSII
jgi:hypothetical protein